MIQKKYVLSVIARMPEDATLGEIARFVDVLDLIGTDSLDDSLTQDMTDFFQKERRKKNRAGRNGVLAFPDGQTAKEMALNMIFRLPEDVASGRILYSLVLMKNVYESLSQVKRGESIEHDVFFDQLEKEDEEKSQARVVAPGSKGSPQNKKGDRQGRSTNGPGLPRSSKSRRPAS